MDFLRRFRDETSGNILIMFALMLLPILSVVGAAVDYTVKAQEATRLQTALDNVVLALAHEPMAKDDAELNALKVKVNKFLSDNYKTPSGASPTVTKITRERGSFSIEASATIDTSFMKVADIKTMDISVSSTAVWGSSKVEVVMALDNTGSMASSNKMTELKKAAKNMIDILAASAYEDGAVKIGIVPFATSVRVPTTTTYKAADWIRFDQFRVCSYRNGREDKCWFESHPDKFKKSNWQGCILDRDQSYQSDSNYAYDVMDIINPTAAAASHHGYDTADTTTLYPAVQSCPPSESALKTVVPLTTDFAGLKTAIDEMTPAGNTNVTIGVVWAQALLSSAKPFDQGVPPGTEGVQKIMIVLTDGENTRNRFTDDNDDSNEKAEKIDARTKLACQNAKTFGTVFTVRVIDGNQGLLKDCATGTTDAEKSQYYSNVTNSAQLTKVFQGIANEINKLRLGS
ncbi:pilus assembly protein TadG-related protein [Flaviflagellibacter deserti]|uniref:Pilus assembly protein TadG-related protein n=1 Tax=Flaviflagellibacter deserti TaxID=2267266 RepID=A0ABV9Z4C9_9HYPH